MRSFSMKLFCLVLILGCGRAALAGMWLKGNLHMHSNQSDGSVPLPEMVAAYEAKGYDFLFVTDHQDAYASPRTDANGMNGGVSTSVEQFKGMKMIVIQGEELSGRLNDQSGRPRRHVNALGKKSWQALLDPNKHGGKADSPTVPDQQYQIDLVNKHGAIPQINHPSWGGMQIKELLEKSNDCFLLEVRNGYVGNSADFKLWDEALSAGRQFYPTGGDDAHGKGAIGKAWTWVYADERSEKGILDALRRGTLYASTGPVVQSYRVDGKGMSVKADGPVKFIGKGGQELATGNDYTFKGDEGYVRAEVGGSAKAWLPAFFPGKSQGWSSDGSVKPGAAPEPAPTVEPVTEPTLEPAPIDEPVPGEAPVAGATGATGAEIPQGGDEWDRTVMNTKPANRKEASERMAEARLRWNAKTDPAEREAAFKVFMKAKRDFTELDQ